MSAKFYQVPSIEINKSPFARDLSATKKPWSLPTIDVSLTTLDMCLTTNDMRFPTYHVWLPTLDMWLTTDDMWLPTYHVRLTTQLFLMPATAFSLMANPYFLRQGHCMNCTWRGRYNLCNLFFWRTFIAFTFMLSNGVNHHRATDSQYLRHKACVQKLSRRYIPYKPIKRTTWYFKKQSSHCLIRSGFTLQIVIWRPWKNFYFFLLA